ncbi:MAG: hypothetical protein LBG64_03280 [Pseudomonadales bacterium]|jgi:hypothetical protein|nr:hypothetical protein [Pseudomonadales bacterium]
MKQQSRSIFDKFKMAVMLAFSALLLASISAVWAQEEIELDVVVYPEATESTYAAQYVEEATPATMIDPELQQLLQEIRDQDLTEVRAGVVDELALLVEQQDLGHLTVFNLLRHAIYGAIARGLPANIIVILLMFPILASLIAFSRHIIGLRGFGIYAPAVLSVAFLSTGVIEGIVIFFLVIISAIVLKKILGHIKLFPLPRTALMLWGISLSVLFFLILAANFNLTYFISLSIFPLLIIILLSENFLETQFFANQKEAWRLTIETIVIAAAGGLILGWTSLRELVILNPEITIVTLCAINFLIGKYRGLRLLEYLRFNSIIKGDS